MYNRKPMKRNSHSYQKLALRWIILGAIGFSGLFGMYFIPERVFAEQLAPQYQVPVYTPTPLPDGRIIYIVQANDTLLRISLISGVSVEELRGMNNLVNDIIVPGQELLLGFGGPAEVTITPGPTPTPTVELPSPTPAPGTGNICILLFNDRNGDSLRQEEEPSLPGGAISVSDRSGEMSETEETVEGLEPQCFEGLMEGEYTISVAVPSGYNPTTRTSYELMLGAGEEAYIDFGAQPNSETLAEEPILPAEGQRSPILGIVGGTILVLGVVLALFASRLMRGK